MPDVGTNEPKRKGGLTSLQAILIIAGVIVCAAAIVVFVILRQSPAQSPPEQGSSVPVVDSDNVDVLMGEIADKAEKGTFVTHMNMVWKFKDATQPSYNAVIGNSDSNNYPFYFDVVLNDTGETIYTSSLIPVGSIVKQIILDKTLDKGQYDATLRYNLVDEENENEVLDSDLGFSLTLVVEN